MFIPPVIITDSARSNLRQLSTQQEMTGRPGLKLDIATIANMHVSLGGDGCLRTSGQNPHWVPVLLNALIDWFNTSPAHILIRAAVFHHELVQIAPFTDMNKELAMSLHRRILEDAGLSARLNKWELPATETGRALSATDAREMIDLSLRSLLMITGRRDACSTARQPAPVDKLLHYLRQHPGSNRGDMQAALPGVSSRMLDRHIQTLREAGLIEHRGSRKTGAYYAV